MGRHFLRRFARKHIPTKVFDNAEVKWESKIENMTVSNPNEIRQEQPVVIASDYFPEIVRQLQKIGVRNFYVYNENLDWK